MGGSVAEARRRVAAPPSPARVSGPAPAAARPAQRVADVEGHLSDVWRNPLIRLGAPVLDLAVRLRDQSGTDDVGELRRRVLDEIKSYGPRATAMGLSAQEVRIARYLICATIDDLVLSTPWGQSSPWAQYGMVSTVYKETWGGERFFDILYHLHREPGNHLRLLELVYVCLALGFGGKYRILDNGRSDLEAMRDGLYRTLCNWRERPPPQALSPRWRGIDMRNADARARVPFWVFWAGALALVVAVYIAFAVALELPASSVASRIETLPPTEALAIAREPLPPELTILEKIRQALAPEISGDKVAVDGKDRTVSVQIRGDEMFASARVSVLPEFEPILKKVGAALDGEPGKITVNGYTDSLPIHTRRFPNNVALSQARADSVAALLEDTLSDPGRLSAAGRGDADPVASNATAEGRARNRRIDIVLTLPDGVTVSSPAGGAVASGGTASESGRAPSSGGTGQ